MVTYLLAIASPTHGVPASMYYTGWANQDSTRAENTGCSGVEQQKVRCTQMEILISVLNLDVGVSNGGPLILHALFLYGL